jgi:hypothetical protein
MHGLHTGCRGAIARDPERRAESGDGFSAYRLRSARTALPTPTCLLASALTAGLLYSSSVPTRFALSFLSACRFVLVSAVSTLARHCVL